MTFRQRAKKILDFVAMPIICWADDGNARKLKLPKYLRKYNLFYADPREVKYIINKKNEDICRSSFVAGGDWDQDAVNFVDKEKDSWPAPLKDRIEAILNTKKKYKENLTWEEVGEIDRLLDGIRKGGAKDGLKSELDIKKRLDKLDSLAKNLESGSSMLSQWELHGISFREKGGIQTALGRDGQIIFLNSDGHHRLGMAMALTSVIPLSIHSIHPDTIKRINDYFRPQNGKLMHCSVLKPQNRK